MGCSPLLLSLLIAAALGGASSANTQAVYCVVESSVPAGATTAAVVLDQLSDAAELECQPLLLNLVGAMGNAVQPSQLGVFNITLKPLTVSFYCRPLPPSSQIVPGSCSAGMDKFLRDLSVAPLVQDKFRYTVRLARASNGTVFDNWRLQYQMPLWAPVLLVGVLLVAGALGLLFALLVCPKTGAGNPQF